MSLAYLQVDSSIHDIWALSWTSTNHLLSGAADGHLRVFDPSDLSAPLYDIPSNPLAITSLSTSSDGKYALSASLDGSVSLVDIGQGRAVAKVETGREGAARGEGEARCWAWSGRSSKLAIRQMTPHQDLNGEKGESGNDEEGEGSGANGLNGDGPRLGRGILAGDGKLLDTGKGKFGMDLQFSPDGRSLALCTEAGNIVIVDTETYEIVANYQSHAMAIRTISWSHDSQWLFSGADDHRIVLHDVRAGSKTGAGGKGEGAVAILQGHTSWVLDVAAGPDGKLLGSGGADSTIKLWDVGTRSAVFSTTTNAAVWEFAWQPAGLGLGTGKQFAVGGDERVVSTYRAAGSV